MTPAREPLPDDAHHPSTPATKLRNRWCKGKVGRPHTPEVMIPPNLSGWKKGCHEAPQWYRRTIMFRRRQDAWWCCHERICTQCGRRLGPPERCPDQPAEAQ